MEQLNYRFGMCVHMGYVGLLCAGLAGQAHAETWIDPTQPPPVVMQRLPMADAEEEPVLTLTAIKESGRHSFAIINARVVKLGERVQGYQLVGVTGTHAVLQDAAQRRVTLALDVVDYRQPVQVASPTRQAVRARPASVKTNKQ
ncbi:MAG TPA: hypothetical protein VGE17_05845 [Methylophilus sp.]